MRWLNYHHLLYFWLIASRGSLTKAAAELRLSPSTLSTQVKALEDHIGEKLFTRVGRGLSLTETGRVVFEYADQIFALGQEMLDVVGGRAGPAHTRFRVGVSDVVPKLVAYRLLEPALTLPHVRVIADEDRPEGLFSSLAVHALDLVLHDAPLPAAAAVRAHSHLLGACEVLVFAPAASAARYRRQFPASLDGAPLLLPMPGSAIRGALDAWLKDRGLVPEVRGEFKDSALMKEFARAGRGLFAGAAVIKREIEEQYDVRAVGTLDGVVERFYAITVERRMRHPAALAVARQAREELFSA